MEIDVSAAQPLKTNIAVKGFRADRPSAVAALVALCKVPRDTQGCRSLALGLDRAINSNKDGADRQSETKSANNE
ncbi:hypothetical protein RRG08_050351 [Elysia crispata]|uniref:Uncharacterized protein n=1 Tax=Elysia crispata TaxID=231223 RepID=A0AAE0XT63_9GAST|nr:hypothetical protein RRG08_050351 [Elysia crispata]